MVYAKGALPKPFLKELPTGGINLVIDLNEHTKNAIYYGENIGNSLEMKHAWISGLQKQAILYGNNPDSTIISLRFAAGGFYALTKIPITTIDHVGIEAETIPGNSFKSFYQQLLNAKLA
jgi:4-hydroxyphenylpyruvate dioxygenase-like putative hemolysin